MRRFTCSFWCIGMRSLLIAACLIGSAAAVTGADHKLARIFYTMIKTHQAFDPAKLGNPTLLRQRQERFLRKQAGLLGFTLQPPQSCAVS